MKAYRDLYPRVCDFENLYLAYRRARKGKRGRPEVAASILRTFARYVDGGMLPNRFPDVGERPEYNTVDATLWYFNALYQFDRYLSEWEGRVQGQSFSPIAIFSAFSVRTILSATLGRAAPPLARNWPG